MAQSQYAEVDDIVLLSLTLAAKNRFGTSATEAALQAASSVADSYIVSQFTLPLTDWDMSLRLAVCNIAAYMLYTQFGAGNPGAPMDEMIKVRYNDALKWLAEVRDQKIFPQWTDSSGASPVTTAAGPYVISDEPVGFTSRGVSDEVSDIWSFWDP